MSDRQIQTPKIVARYMASMIPDGVKTILEPSPGEGNLVMAIQENGSYKITAPDDFFLLKPSRFDCIVMNPPFSTQSLNNLNAPASVKKLTGSKTGYYFLMNLLTWSDNIIALMPWYFIINSQKRTNILVEYGLVSVTNLPRKTFNSIVQTVVIQLQYGYRKNTIFKQFNF